MAPKPTLTALAERPRPSSGCDANSQWCSTPSWELQWTRSTLQLIYGFCRFCMVLQRNWGWSLVQKNLAIACCSSMRRTFLLLRVRLWAQLMVASSSRNLHLSHSLPSRACDPKNLPAICARFCTRSGELLNIFLCFQSSKNNIKWQPCIFN